jgi:sirohydrochlorin ferrochelatase
VSEAAGSTGLLIAHGSPDARHSTALRRLADAVAAESAMPTGLAFLEHDEPLLTGWLRSQVARTSEGGPVREVRAIGLLLASGYHAQVDIPRALDAVSPELTVTNLGTLGSRDEGAGRWVLPVLERAVASVGGSDESPVVLVAAGSSQEPARADLRATCALWQESRQGPVLPAAVTGPDPRPDSVVAALQVDPADVVVVPLMLAPGALADRATAAAETVGVRCADTLTSADRTPPELVTHIVRRLHYPPSV